jgi:cyclase
LVREAAEGPITVLGGAGKLDDIRSVISKYKVIGVSCGSLFVFKGKYRAVLISYPNKQEKKELYQQ